MANLFNVIEFLEELQKYPCLWDKSIDDFQNNVKRDHAESQLLQFTSTSGISNVNELRRKINNIRSVFYSYFNKYNIPIMKTVFVKYLK